MDINKFLELLQQSPFWLKCGIAVWAIVGAGLITTLFVFLPSREINLPSPQSPGTNKSARENTIDNGHLTSVVNAEQEILPEQRSAERYFSHLARLDGRFLQRQEFTSSMAGKTVIWRGAVEKIYEDSGDIVIHIGLIASKKDAGFVIMLPQEFKTRAFSLQRNDNVEVEGVLGRSGAAVVHGLKLTLLTSNDN